MINNLKIFLNLTTIKNKNNNFKQEYEFFHLFINKMYDILAI